MKSWTREESAFLRANAFQTSSWLARHLNRSPKAISTRRWAMGLTGVNGRPRGTEARRRKRQLLSELECRTCRQTLPISKFYADDSRSRGVKPSCRRCILAGIAELERHPLGDRCAACGSTFNLVRDHDHRTGKWRGTLCHYCNIALGYLEDDLLRLEALIAYLERSQISAGK